jgi:5-oxoprolinase (ATP-hydrolysing) subunit A
VRKIHLNCDLGEGGEYDVQLMSLVSACNIACGGHAGNLETMQHTVDLAMENEVEIGAHPSYPDKENFGRISLVMEPKELKRTLVAQILSLKQITEAEGGRLNHVKCHGALYNDSQKDENIAAVIVEAIQEFHDPLFLFAPENSVISHLAEGRLKVVHEAFADRNYNADRSLVSRLYGNALITEKEEVFEHLFSMFWERKIKCVNGEKIETNATTFCLHSDTPNSVENLTYLHQKFREHNIKIQHA